MNETASAAGIGPSTKPSTLDELLWTPENRAALHQLAASPRSSPTRISTLARPKRRQLTRKLVMLQMPRTGVPTSPPPDLPSIDPRARFLSDTFVTSRRTLPTSVSEPTLLTSSISCLGLPLEAAVPWRSPRSPPWARRSLAHNFETARQRESQPTALQIPTAPPPPISLLRPPQWNSSQLSMYSEWPKGFLLPQHLGHLRSPPNAKVAPLPTETKDTLAAEERKAAAEKVAAKRAAKRAAKERAAARTRRATAPSPSTT